MQLYVHIQLTIHHTNNRALKPSEFKINAILDFARFLSSGCFVGDLWFILGGFAVVVCHRLFCMVFWEGGGVLPGGFCPGGFVREGFVLGGFVRGEVCSEGFCPGGLSGGVLSGGLCPGGFCPRGFVRGVLSRWVLSTGGFCPSGGFVQRGIVREVLSRGFCPRIQKSEREADYSDSESLKHACIFSKGALDYTCKHAVDNKVKNNNLGWGFVQIPQKIKNHITVY